MYITKAKELLKSRGLVEKVKKEMGCPIFLAISGSHMFGFPSENSDYDIRGVFITPTERFWKLKKPKHFFEFNDGIIDMTVYEIGHYLEQIIKSNGNYLEWPNSDFIIYQNNSEFQKLKDITEKAVSKKLFDHYSNFSQDLFMKAQETQILKQYLYALRTAMAGIYSLETGKIEPNIKYLNKIFKIDIINDLVRVKEEEELINTPLPLEKKINSIFLDLSQRLQKAFEQSKLAEEPLGKEEIEKYLIRLRKDNMTIN